MLGLAEEYQIHLEDSHVLSKIGYNLIGSIGYLFMCFFYSATIYNVCSGRTIGNDMILPHVVVLIVGIYFVRFIYKSYFPKDKPIRIGSKGIIDADGKVYPWEKIESAFLKNENKSRYLCIFIKDDNNQIDQHNIWLTGYYVSEKKIVEAIECWSGKDIGQYEDHVRNNYIKNLLRSGKMTEEEINTINEKLTLYTPYFQKLKKKYKMCMILMAPIFFIVFILSFYLADVKTPLQNYGLLEFFRVISLKLGVLFLYVFCTCLVKNYKTKQLRRNPDLKDLSEYELDQLVVASDLKESSLTVKVLLIPVVIWLLFVIYTLSVALGVL